MTLCILHNTREITLYLCIHDVRLLGLRYPVALRRLAERRGKERRKKNTLAFDMYVALLANRPGRNQDSLSSHVKSSSISQSVASLPLEMILQLWHPRSVA